MDTETLLTALGAYLADVVLAQFDVTGSYRDDPETPGVLFGDADVPDTAVVLTVTGRTPSLRQWDVAMAFRSTGVNPFGVETLADRVAEHWRAAFDFQTAGVWHGGSITTMPTVTLPGGIVVTEVTQTARGTAELSSPAKHKGSRFVRSDGYRITLRD